MFQIDPYMFYSEKTRIILFENTSNRIDKGFLSHIQLSIVFGYLSETLQWNNLKFSTAKIYALIKLQYKTFCF